MKSFIIQIAIVLLSTNSLFGQYDSISFDYKSFETIWGEYHVYNKKDMISGYVMSSDEDFRYTDLQFYDLNSDTFPETIIRWTLKSYGAKVIWNYSGLVIFDIKNATILFDKLYNDCLVAQSAWVHPETNEPIYKDDASCCRGVSFYDGYFEFGEIENSKGDKVDYPCPSVIQVGRGTYKFDGKKMVKIK